MQQVAKCPICGAPYKVYSHTVADQSACAACVEEAERRINYPSTHEKQKQAHRRQRHFGN